MDAGIADTINRADAHKVAKHLDLADWLSGHTNPWHTRVEADVFFSPTCPSGEKAWFFGALAAGVPDLHFDGDPADCDWDNLFSHMRAEVLARRDPETPHARAAETQPCGVV